MTIRSRLKLPRLVLAVFTLTFIASTAYAQSARTLLKRGNQLFASGRYDAAFKAFEKGNKKSPRPVFLGSMALCMLKMHQHTKALELYKQYVQKYPKAKDIDKIKSNVNRLETVANTRIELKSTPPGAKIFIDVQSRGDLGVTPRSITVEPGTHTVLLEHKGYRLTTRIVEIKAGQTLPLAVPLEVPFNLKSDPPGAEVRIDAPKAKPVGKTPLSNDNAGIAPGEHTVYVNAPGFITFKQRVTVAAGKPFSMATASLKLGLKITSTPPGASVTVDNKAVGKTPLELPVAPGPHDVKVSMAGIQTVDKRVVAAAGKSSEIDVKFKVGLLSMRTGPEGATVKVGDRTLGKAPLTAAVVPVGSHPVEVTYPGRQAFRRRLAFDDTHQIDADIRLGRTSWPFWVSAGVAVAGLAVGAIAGAIALKNANNANDYWVGTNQDGSGSRAEGRCTDSGGERAGFGFMWKKSDASADGTPTGATEPYSSDPCIGTGVHHASTAGFVVGGVAAAFALVYYIFFQRPSVDIDRKARQLARDKARRGRRTAALPAKLPDVN